LSGTGRTANGGPGVVRGPGVRGVVVDAASRDAVVVVARACWGVRPADRDIFLAGDGTAVNLVGKPIERESPNLARELAGQIVDSASRRSLSERLIARLGLQRPISLRARLVVWVMLLLACGSALLGSGLYGYTFGVARLPGSLAALPLFAAALAGVLALRPIFSGLVGRLETNGRAKEQAVGLTAEERIARRAELVPGGPADAWFELETPATLTGPLQIEGGSLGLCLLAALLAAIIDRLPPNLRSVGALTRRAAFTGSLGGIIVGGRARPTGAVTPVGDIPNKLDALRKTADLDWVVLPLGNLSDTLQGSRLGRARRSSGDGFEALRLDSGPGVLLVDSCDGLMRWLSPAGHWAMLRLAWLFLAVSVIVGLMAAPPPPRFELRVLGAASRVGVLADGDLLADFDPAARGEVLVAVQRLAPGSGLLGTLYPLDVEVVATAPVLRDDTLVRGLPALSNLRRSLAEETSFLVDLGAMTSDSLVIQVSVRDRQGRTGSRHVVLVGEPASERR
jgi:hypothetical protein